VRIHENAHMAAAGGLAIRKHSLLVPQVGPDGRLCAVGGHVQIDVSAESSPEETILKMQRVVAAAMSPSEPSTADMKVVVSAMSKLVSAREQIDERREVAEEAGDNEESPGDAAVSAFTDQKL